MFFLLLLNKCNHHQTTVKGLNIISLTPTKYLIELTSAKVEQCTPIQPFTNDAARTHEKCINLKFKIIEC